MALGHTFDDLLPWYKWLSPNLGHKVYGLTSLGQTLPDLPSLSRLRRESHALQVILTLSRSDAQISRLFQCVPTPALNHSLLYVLCTRKSWAIFHKARLTEHDERRCSIYPERDSLFSQRFIWSRANNNPYSTTLALEELNRNANLQ